MQKYIKYISILIIAVGLVVGGSLLLSNTNKINNSNSSKTITSSVLQSSLSYNGEEGKDALVLLKQHASAEIGGSGLVEAINGRIADSKSHEYWAFYVNGKLAEVWPKDYQTKNSDVILWKIEKY